MLRTAVKSLLVFSLIAWLAVSFSIPSSAKYQGLF
jgi:hypothetical protein